MRKKKEDTMQRGIEKKKGNMRGRTIREREKDKRKGKNLYEME